MGKQYFISREEFDDVVKRLDVLEKENNTLKKEFLVHRDNEQYHNY